jgi:hypothetical protein
VTARLLSEALRRDGLMLSSGFSPFKLSPIAVANVAKDSAKSLI